MSLLYYKYGIHINIVKVYSHKGNHGNQMADKIAREAANIARMCKFGDSKFVKYKLQYNPVNVDIAKDLIKLRKKIKLDRKNEWKGMKQDRINNHNKNRYYGCHNFEKIMIDHNNNVSYGNKDMRKELRYLSQKEVEIITKSRTEHINLNHYLFTMNVIKGKYGYKCRFCNASETVDHFLIDCPGVQEEMHQKLHKNNIDYEKCRIKLRKNLRRTTIFFKNPLNFNTINILFPHTWQRRIHGKKRNSNNIINTFLS